MTRRAKLLGGGAVVVAIGAGAAGVALATGGDDNEAQIRGSALQKASAAALAHTGGGEVSDTEVADEESRYEVEVTRDDGSQIDVQLNGRFEVVGEEAETGREGGSGAP